MTFDPLEERGPLESNISVRGDGHILITAGGLTISVALSADDMDELAAGLSYFAAKIRSGASKPVPPFAARILKTLGGVN